MNPPGLRVRLAALGFGLLLALLLIEVGLRVAGVSHPVFMGADPDRGFAYVPGATGTWAEEGNAPFRINSSGYRDRERDARKPRGVYRVALLGDSFMAGFGVPEDSLMAGVLERELAACGALRGRTPEVFNYGVLGYGTAQELITYRIHARHAEPDLVVLAVCTGNDLRNNSAPLSPGEIRPFFTVSGDSLVEDRGFRDALAEPGLRTRLKSLQTALVNRSRVLQVVRQAKHLLGHRLAQGAGGTTGAELVETGLDHQIYGAPPDSVWSAAWDVTERLIATLAAEVRRDGARFILVTLSQSNQVRPGPPQRREFLGKLSSVVSEPDLFYPERRFAGLSEREGFTYVPLAMPLQARADRDGTLSHGFAESGNLGQGHWNETGHREGGRIVAETVCATIAP